MTPTYPGVYIQETQSPVHPITGVATSIAAFVGYTEQGIDNRAEQLYSFSDFERLFGGLASDSELSYAVQQFFSNGGTEAYVVRVPRHGAVAAKVGVVFSSTSASTWLFYALSSGSWANGNLVFDIDLNGLGEAITGTMTVSASGLVTGTNTHFKQLEANQFLVFASDPAHAMYQIGATPTSDTQLQLSSTSPAFTTSTPTGAVVYSDSQVCNLTVTNLQSGTVESFPEVSFNSSATNFVGSVLNDFDTGSQLINVTPPSTPDSSTPVPTGIIGTPPSLYTVLTTLGSATSIAGNVQVTSNSSTVTGAGLGGVSVGQVLIFSTDPNSTPYTVVAVQTAPIGVTLSSNFAGATASTAASILTSQIVSQDWYVSLSVMSPGTAPAPLPITAKVFSDSVSSAPLSLAGYAAQIQSALNSALSIGLPGASVQVSAINWWGAPALRLNGVIPSYPDAVFQFVAPPSGDSDLAAQLGLNPTSPTTLAVQNVGHYALGTGDLFPLTPPATFATQTSSVAGTDGATPTALPWTADLIGDPGAFTGIYALEKVDLFNILCIPDATRALSGSPSTLDPTVDPNAIYSAAIAYCDQRRAFLLLDAPPNINTAAAAVDWKTTLLTVNDPNGAAYFPRLRLPDAQNNYQLRTFAPCGVVAGLYARIDGTRGVWKAPAGTEATLSGVQTMTYKLTDNEQGSINPLGLNCARIFPVYGPVMWGARTLVGADVEASQWKYVPVRRIALYIEESLYRGTKWVVFEPNDEPLWASIRLNVTAFMDALFRKQAFQGQTADQAYFVKCDSDTTTQADIDLGIVNILVGFAPLQPAEFVVITISQMSGQAQS